MRQPSKVVASSLFAIASLFVLRAAAQNPRDLAAPGVERFTERVVASGLGDPWEVTWGPDGMLWITERTAFRVTRIDPVDGRRQVALTLDDVYQSVVQDGLLGLALHPDLLKGRGRDYVYLAYVYDAAPGADVTRRLRVRRYTYDARTQTLGAPRDLLDDLPAHDDHGGGRLAIGPDGMLYVTRGDQGANFLANYCNTIRAQDLPTAAAVAARDWSSYQGKILRMTLDGGIPVDNPAIAGVRSHVFSYGLRNPQGLSFGPTGLLYASEHGPSTDDEIDLVRAGGNYGWPHVAGFNDDRAYEYAQWARSSPEPCASLKFSALTVPPSVPRASERSWQHPDFVPPLATLFTAPAGYDLAANGSTTIGPGGLEVYSSDGIPGWKTSLLVTGMRTGALYRVQLSDDGRAMVGAPLQYVRQADRYRDLAIAPDGRRIFLVADTLGVTAAPGGVRVDRLAHPGALLEYTYAGAR